MTPDVQIRSVSVARIALAGVVALLLHAPAAAPGGDEGPAAGISVYSSSQCASGRFCLWSGGGYSGAFWSTSGSGLLSTGLATAGSVWNRTAADVRVFSGPGGTGTVTCWNAGAQASSVSIGSLSIRTMAPTTC